MDKFIKFNSAYIDGYEDLLNYKINISSENDIFLNKLEKSSAYRRQQLILGRKLLAGLLGVSLDEIIRNDVILYGDHGKPFFDSRYKRDTHFSISHTNNLVSVAISNVVLGFDIENKSRMLNLKESNKIYNDDEKKFLKKMNRLNRNKMMLKYWMIKESILKNQGLGLNISPSLISVNDNFKKAFFGDLVFSLNYVEVNENVQGVISTLD